MMMVMEMMMMVVMMMRLYMQKIPPSPYTSYSSGSSWIPQIPKSNSPITGCGGNDSVCVRGKHTAVHIAYMSAKCVQGGGVLWVPDLRCVGGCVCVCVCVCDG